MECELRQMCLTDPVMTVLRNCEVLVIMSLHTCDISLLSNKQASGKSLEISSNMCDLEFHVENEHDNYSMIMILNKKLM